MWRFNHIAHGYGKLTIRHMPDTETDVRTRNMSQPYENPTTPASIDPVTPSPYQGTTSDSTPATGADTSDSTTDVAKDQAGKLAEDAKAGGQQVADRAKDEAQQVVSTATDQAKGLYSKARGELYDQASTQQMRLADSVRSLGQELSSMVSGSQDASSQSGPATSLMSSLSGQLDQAAGWLDQREPGEVLDEVTRFARRKPGIFLALAALTGLVAGRLTRSLTDDARAEEAPARGVSPAVRRTTYVGVTDASRAPLDDGTPATGYGTAYGTTGTYAGTTGAAGTVGTGRTAYPADNDPLASSGPGLIDREPQV